ncbi:HlyD family efflux transporter periplasmic adaptor subunit [Nitrospira sp. Nam74]
MADDLFSASWYRVERLKPRLRGHVRLQRHQYRGQVWYVLHDLSTDRFHRFASSAHVVIGLMNGQRTIHEIWEAANAQLGDDGPTQDEVIHLISQLHAADVLMIDNMTPNTAELARRAAQQARRKHTSAWMNLFAFRIPLWDPDRFLSRIVPFIRPFLGRTAGAIWMLVVGMGVLMAAMHWTDLTQDFFDQALAPQNLVLLWLLFPVLKLAHEMGHGIVTKAFGGEVHELGMMLMVFTPVPYVEASAAWSFQDKWRRILVGAAGMMVELFLASIALVIWLHTEPGRAHLLAYNTILIAGASTVLFNANPLLRFDGYYMLMDFLEIPNLKQRANRYFEYLSERYVLAQRDAQLPIATTGERVWFVLYGVASAAYRVLVVVGILLFLGDQFPLVALLFAGLTAVTMIFRPLGKGIMFLFSNPRLRLVRVRAVATVALLLMVVIGTVGFVPMPFHTMAEGIVWLPEDAFVRAGVDGFVDRVIVQPGGRVQPGDVLVTCRNSELSTRLRVLNAQLQELEARRREQAPTDRVKTEMLEEEIRYTTKARDEAQTRVNRLVIRSQRNGTFVAPTAQDLPGRFLHQGDLVAHVVDVDTLTVRAIVDQWDIDLVRNHLQEVQVRLAERIGDIISAQLERVAPAAVKELPSAALGADGGGQLPMDPKDEKGLTAMQRVFLVDLIMADDAHVINAGGRVHVRFAHEPLPFAEQWSRYLRQLFLTRFNV